MDTKPSVVLRGGRLIDGLGEEAIENATIVIQGPTITGVGERNDVETPEGADVIDLDGRTVMPGLIDAHLHLNGLKTDRYIEESLVVPPGVRLLRAAESAKRLLAHGFTTVKDTGGSNALYLKRAVNEGSIPGPRILAAGYVLTQTFGHGDDFMFLPLEWADGRTSHGFTSALMCDGVEACMRSARFALREGADFIKICTSGGVMSEKDKPGDVQFTPEEVKAIVGVARNAKTFVTAHCMSAEAMVMSIENGVKTIDHAWFLDDTVIEMGRRKDTVFVATLSALEKLLDGGTEAGYPEWTMQKCRGIWETVIANMRRLHDAGVTVAAGTDFLDTGLMRMGDNALELEILVKHAGFKPMDAIASMTRNGAMACGIGGSTGTIEKGKFADILVIEGNPLDNISILQDPEQIRMVIKEGVIVSSKEVQGQNRPMTSAPGTRN